MHYKEELALVGVSVFGLWLLCSGIGPENEVDSPTDSGRTLYHGLFMPTSSSCKKKRGSKKENNRKNPPGKGTFIGASLSLLCLQIREPNRVKKKERLFTRQ